jgi:tetratricopeptide (TPR) repeat protein
MEAFMAENNNIPANFVKKETMFIVASVCLLVGFLGGVLFTVYKGGSGGGPVPVIEKQQISAEQSRRALALEREVAANPDNAGAWTELGNLYFGMDEYEKSIKSYRQALELDPANANVWTDMGVMYRRSGQPEQALEIFIRASALDPNLPQPRFNQGVVLLFDLNRVEEGLETWEELLRVNPAATAPNGQPLGELIAQYREELKK